MPRMDGKGPQGTGPIGRGQGNCRRNNLTGDQTAEEQKNPPAAGQGQGLGQGKGCGRGLGNRGGGGGGGGRGQGGGNR